MNGRLSSVLVRSRTSSTLRPRASSVCVRFTASWATFPDRLALGVFPAACCGTVDNDGGGVSSGDFSPLGAAATVASFTGSREMRSPVMIAGGLISGGGVLMGGDVAVLCGGVKVFSFAVTGPFFPGGAALAPGLAAVTGRGSGFSGA